MYRDWIEIVCRILLALAIGAVIGWDREKSQRPAGLRTHILVCVGAATCMMVGYYGLEQAHGQGSVDPTRMASQVISGIGFLGAGTILREGFSVRGLTTAASLWTVACIGLAVGIGYYFGAIFAAVMVFLMLTLGERVEHRVTFYARNKAFFTIESTKTVKTMAGIQRIIREHKLHSSEMKITDRLTDQGEHISYLIFQLEERSHQNKVRWEEILKEMRSVEGITGVEMEQL